MADGRTDAHAGDGDAPWRTTVSRARADEVRADEAAVAQSAVLRLEAGTASVDRSAVGTLRARRATVRGSAVAGLAAGSAAIDGARVGVLAAPVVRGDVHAWIDMRAGFALGLGLALGGFALNLARRLFR